MRILLDTSFLLPFLGVEVTGAAEALENDKAQLLGRVTSVAINPLLFAFLTIVFFKVVEVL